MRAARLHAIATLLESEAVLIKSNAPKDPAHLPLINFITSRIAGVIAASHYVVAAASTTYPGTNWQAPPH